jgi:hypothetical protein
MLKGEMKYKIIKKIEKFINFYYKCKFNLAI